ncbi:MAG TPA: DUF1080 domain-containing protein [Steroidobacteraceae bacterium]|nr:DUF1080 domain-containing protein [Steroidobacteraceae bacterium]
MRKLSVLASGLAMVVLSHSAAAVDDSAAWKPLFNGKNLNGWTVEYASKVPQGAPAPGKFFKVEDGAIHTYPNETPGTEQPNAYLLSDKEYKDYVISLEYKWGEKKFEPRMKLVRDAGLLYNVHRLRDGDWPAAIEAQIQEGDVGDLWAVSSRASSTIDPKTQRFALLENGAVPLTVGNDGKFERVRHGRVNEFPGWNTLQVIVQGDRSMHIVNGVTNMRVGDMKAWDAGSNSWVKLDHGRIALQAEAAEIWYRNIKIRPLTKTDAFEPEPKVTEVWFPVPAKVTPGASPGAPPSDAIILFDGKNIDGWQSTKQPGAAQWTVANGELVVKPGTGDIQTKEKFGDVQLHVEWTDPKLPPDKVNQDRGNSGIFLQDIYEVQVLDNFENPTYVNGMVGSIYKQFPPLVNATQPAETWNVYDIIFTAPRFNADGSLASPARLTVLLNGILVQNNSVLKGGTTYIGAPNYVAHGDMPLRLQDHGHLVRFRNIWLRKL